MRCLTLTQPWASLIALGEKTVETRGWRPPARIIGERIAIHAAKGLAPVGGIDGLAAMCTEPVFRGALNRHGQGLASVLDARGLVLCTALVGEGVYAPDMEMTLLTGGRLDEIAFGDYGEGRWAWPLSDVRALRSPIEVRGALGLPELGRSLSIQIETRVAL